MTRDQSARRLVILGAAAVASGAAFWIATTQTLLGQQLADLVLYGRISASSDVLRAAAETLAAVSLGFVGLAALGLVAVGFARGGVRLAIAVVASIGGANLTSQVLKTFLDRPNLLGDAAYATGNSFPSGHVALVTSLGLACILVSPRRLRTAVSIGAAVLIAVVGASAIIAGWHRLADVEGGIMISLAWASLVTAVLVVSQGWVPRRTWGRGLGGQVTSLVATVGATAVVAGAVGVTFALVDPTPFAELIRVGLLAPGTFVAAVSITAGTALIACVGYVWAMLGVALERPR